MGLFTTRYSVKIWIMERKIDLRKKFFDRIIICKNQKSLDKGRDIETVLYKIVCKIRYAFFDKLHTSINMLTTSVMTRNLKKTFVKSYPSYRLLFKWFILEIHKWMGDEEY